MTRVVSDEQLQKYLLITREALVVARDAPVVDAEATAIILDMVSRYVSDAEHFLERGDVVLSFAALNYAHGWLDCGARLGVFTVRDSRLFTVDD